MSKGRSTSELQQTEITEADRVMEFRLEFLLAAGYSIENALTLASNDAVDWHTAVDLLVSGCPEDRAMEILL